MRRWFLMTAGLIFLTTGLAKSISAFGHAKILIVPDPIFHWQFRHLLLAIGLVEIVASCSCFFKRTRGTALALTAWLSTGFCLYRVGLWFVGWDGACPCLGTLSDALHVRAHLADNILKALLFYLLLGSYATLFWLWRQRRRCLSPLAQANLE